MHRLIRKGKRVSFGIASETQENLFLCVPLCISPPLQRGLRGILYFLLFPRFSWEHTFSRSFASKLWSDSFISIHIPTAGDSGTRERNEPTRGLTPLLVGDAYMRPFFSPLSRFSLCVPFDRLRAGVVGHRDCSCKRSLPLRFAVYPAPFAKGATGDFVFPLVPKVSLGTHFSIGSFASPYSHSQARAWERENDSFKVPFFLFSEFSHPHIRNLFCFHW